MKTAAYITMIWLGLVMVTPLGSADEGQHNNGISLFSTEGDFESVRTFLDEAIVGRGLVVNSVSHVGDMLARTGKDLGATKQIYKHAEVVEFCSASLSREMMEADPANIVFCPYSIAIYERADQPGKIYLAHRRLKGLGQGKEVMQKIDTLLDEIIRAAIE